MQSGLACQRGFLARQRASSRLHCELATRNAVWREVNSANKGAGSGLTLIGASTAKGETPSVAFLLIPQLPAILDLDN